MNQPFGGVSATRANKPFIYCIKGQWRCWSFEHVDRELLNKSKEFVKELNRINRTT